MGVQRRRELVEVGWRQRRGKEDGGRALLELSRKKEIYRRMHLPSLDAPCHHHPFSLGLLYSETKEEEKKGLLKVGMIADVFFSNSFLCGGAK